MKPIGYRQAVKEAKELIEPEHATWTPKMCEYTRGQCELLASLYPGERQLTADRAQEIAREIGVPAKVVAKLYA